MSGTSRVGANAGLWIGDPDIDAISRNFSSCKAQSWGGRKLVLAQNTWTPINSQNTAIVRELLPAYYYVLMGQKVNGLVIDRFGDILSGLFLKKVADALGYSVAIGPPVCDHRRTVHDLFADLHCELAGLVLLEDFTAWLEELSTHGGSAVEVYRNIAERLAEDSGRFRSKVCGDGGIAFFLSVSEAMCTWLKAIESTL